MREKFAYFKYLYILLYIVRFDDKKKMRITYKDYPLTLLKIIYYNTHKISYSIGTISPRHIITSP